MYRYYRKFGQPTDDVFVHMYNADYQAMKYKRTRAVAGPIQPYVQPMMQVRKVPDADSLSKDNGTFLVCRVEPDKCQRLYVVTPTINTSKFDGSNFITADHFTFQVNHGGGVPASKRLQMHRTMYLPIPNASKNGTPSSPTLLDSPPYISSSWGLLITSRRVPQF